VSAQSKFAKLRPYFVLLLLTLVLYLPGIVAMPPVDRDEARFAEATRQMVQSGDFLRPRFLSEQRFQKPVGIYWLQAAAVEAAGPAKQGSISIYRIPSLIGAIAAVLLTCAFGQFLFGTPTALLAGALLASSVGLTVEANLAKTDAMLLACVVACFGCLGHLYVNSRRQESSQLKYALGFWISVALGVLIKGPVLPLIVMLSVGTLLIADRAAPEGRASNKIWLKSLRAELGVPLALIISLPWIIAVGVSSGWGFYRSMLSAEILPKMLGGHQSHGAPPGYYSALLLVTFWPGSLFAAAGIIRGAQNRSFTAERFLLAWAAPCWLFFELMPTKLPNYVLPAYPALAILIARAVAFLENDQASGWARRVESFNVVGWSIVSIGMGAAMIAAPVLVGGSFEPIALVPALAAITLAVVCARLAYVRRFDTCVRTAVFGAVLVLVPLRVWVLPEMNQLWLSRDAANAIARERNRTDSPNPIALVGYNEPSIIFLLGGTAEPMVPEVAAEYLRDHPRGLVLVSDDSLQKFAQALRALAAKPRQVWTSEGINYSKGRRVRLTLFGLVTDVRAHPLISETTARNSN
jgi:4-amino-4-deoxy-L-arabinose transferase-like glycosyltransferase